MPRRIIDLSGQKFNKLTVLNYSHTNNNAYWLCLCECGNKITVASSQLRRKRVGSCGCIKKKHGMRKTSEYAIYSSAKSRCNNVNHQEYKNYGARGIKFKFESFIEFFNEIGHKPSPQHSLDRINNNKGYEPGNIKWSTKTEQNSNKRTNHLITYKNVTRTLTQWANIFNIKQTTLKGRIGKLNWSIEKALNTPVRKKTTSDHY